MKKGIFLIAYAISVGFTSNTLAQEDGKRKIEEDMQNFYKQYDKDFEDFKRKREEEIRKLEQEYQDYYNTLMGLKTYFKEKKDTANANAVDEMMQYEKSVCQASGKEISVTKKVVITAENLVTPSKSGLQTAPEYKPKEKPEPIKDTQQEKSKQQTNQDQTTLPAKKVEEQTNQQTSVELLGKKVVEETPTIIEEEKPKEVTLTVVAQEKPKEEPKEEPKPAKKEVTTLVPLPEEGASVPCITPLPKGKSIITSPFGTRMHPVLKVPKMHAGVDFGSGMNAEVYAAADGKVTLAQLNNSYGEYVIIEHKNGYTSVYSHLTKYTVKVGQKVKKGEIIGYTGKTGRVTGPHLHYEVRLKGTPVNPDGYLTHKK